MKRFLLSVSLVLLLRPTLLPADEATVHIVPFSHQDGGYADNPYMLRTENRLGNLFRAIKYCAGTETWPEAAQYRYQQEIAEPLPFLLSLCTPEERESLAKYMRDGRIKVGANFTTVIADRLNTESFSRLFYLANRHLPDMLAVPPSKVALFDDVVGIPWSLPIYAEAAGVPWIFHGHNNCGRCDELDSAPLVRWTGAGGTGSVLVHGEAYDVHHAPVHAKLVPPYFKSAGATNTPLFLSGWDFAVADLKPSDFAKAWNEKNPGQTARVSTFEDWFPAQEKLTKPPVVAGKSGPCQWSDQPLGDALSFGRARTAAELLPVSEIWNSVALNVAGKSEGGYAYPWFDFTQAWHNLLSNCEHTCGAACWRCKDEAGFSHYETELVEHREESSFAHDTATRTLDTGLAALTSHIASPAGNGLAVFNASTRPRTEAVTFALPNFAGKKHASFAVTDDATGESAPCQWLDATTLAFTAKAVPALGYRTYRLTEQKDARAVTASNATAVETPFYKIAIDPASGAVTSLFDKKLGKELVKKDAPHAFNRYLRLHIENPKAPDVITSPEQSDAKIKIERGPVADIVSVIAKADNTGSLVRTITLWHDLPRIDFALRVDKQSSGRNLADYFQTNLHGKEAVFTSLPLDIPNFKAVYEVGGGGVAEPIRDQFNGTGTAYYAAQHFADISNDEFGVTVCPINASLVQFGQPRADALSRVRPKGESLFEKNMKYPQESTLQLFLMSNMFTTNVRIDQPGPHEFRWAMRGHAGDWKKGAANEFGEDVARPLAVRMLPKKATGSLPAGATSFAAVDAPNVAISTLKPAEWNGDGYIVRLVETAGRATEASLSVPFLGKLASSGETNLVETDLGKPIPVAADGAMKISLPAYGVKTLRLVPATAKPAVVSGLTAKALSDMEVGLEWKPVPGAAFYRIYSPDTEAATPSPLNLVAVIAATRFIDNAQDRGAAWITRRMRAGTNYRYLIEAVSADNVRGPISPVVQVTTATKPTCAPAAVADLHSILVSPLAAVNGVNLLWRANPETNITSYEIHRSKEAGFAPSGKTLLKSIPVRIGTKGETHQDLTQQSYYDKAVGLKETLHYRVRAMSTGGLSGAFSTEATVTTKTEIGVSAPIKTDGKALMGRDGAAE